MLETPRLKLVPHAPEYFEAYAGFWAKDPGPFLRSIAPMRPEEAWMRLLRHYGHWQAFGYGPFLGFDENNVLVAEGGYVDFKRGVSPRFENMPEAMWKIDLERQGQGLATEAMAAITPWYDARRIAPRAVCMIDPGNTASIRVAQRLGFTEFERTLYRDTPVILFERPAP